MEIRLFQLSIHLICIGIFLTPSVLREGFLRSQWGILNLFSWIGIVLLFFSLNKSNANMEKGEKANIGAYLLSTFFFAAFFILNTLLLSKIENASLLKYVCATIFPCMLIFIKMPPGKTLEFLDCFCKYLTMACTFVVICGLLDLFFNAGIGAWVARYTMKDSLFLLLSEGRMVAYWGHSLLTAEMMLLCFSFNSLYDCSFREKESVKFTFFYCIISVAGIALCGSKTGLVLFVIEFMLLYSNPKRIKYLVVIIAGIYLIYLLGLLDLVLGRFAKGVESGDLTTGRNTAFTALIESDLLNFKWFKGHAGNELGEAMIAALEYPPLRWAYLFGIIFSIIISTILFIVPVIKCIKNRTYKVLIVMLIMIADVNSYNGLTTQSDHMFLYCIIILLLLNISSIIKGDKNDENMLLNPKFIYTGRNPKGSYYIAK